MRLGLDFDNTIVSYDRLFYKVAKEQDLIPNEIPTSKIAIRNFLRNQNKEHLWTEMQGYVYGPRLAEAEIFPGLIEALHKVKKAGINISIVSHKTLYPYEGPKYNLHQAAWEWIESVLGKNGENLIDMEDVFFQETKEKKIKHIKDIKCDFYIDDLPEILLSPGFPKNTTPVLFDPMQHYKDNSKLIILPHWSQLQRLLENLC